MIIPILEMRWILDRLIINMGIPIARKTVSQNTEECKILLIPAWDAWFWQQSPTGGIRDSGTIALTDISSQFILDTWS